MGIIEDGINGGFKGKVGTAVGYHRFGKWIIRALPRESVKNKIGTVAQQKSRSKFKKMQQFLDPIVDFIRVGFNLEARVKMMTAHNAAKSYNMRHAFTENDEIDFSNVRLCSGILSEALSPTVEKDDTGLHFKWVDNSDDPKANARDQVMVLAYDDMIYNEDGKKQPDAYYSLSGARRRSGTEYLKVYEESKGHTLHTYIAFISDDRDKISNSVYVGEIVF